MLIFVMICDILGAENKDIGIALVRFFKSQTEKYNEKTDKF